MQQRCHDLMMPCIFIPFGHCFAFESSKKMHYSCYCSVQLSDVGSVKGKKLLFAI